VTGGHATEQLPVSTAGVMGTPRKTAVPRCPEIRPREDGRLRSIASLGLQRISQGQDALIGLEHL
jgi:hypothetical protein